MYDRLDYVSELINTNSLCHVDVFMSLPIRPITALAYCSERKYEKGVTHS